MSLQIVYGRSGTGKTTCIFNEISKTIDNGKKKYIITPEQFSFTAEKELLRSIKENTGASAVINAEVLTFNRMAHRVLSDVGGACKTTLSNSGKSMLIYSILSDKKNDLKFLGKSESNIELILTQITELKKHGVSIEILQTLMESVQDNKYLYSKLNDIYTVYSKYDEKIKDKYIDENDSLTVLAEKLNQTSMFDDCEIYIDEFVGFTKQEYSIIERLMQVASKVVVTVCADEVNVSKESNPDIDVFYSNKQTAKRILQIAKDNKIEILKDIFLEDAKRFKSNELAHLEKNIFKIPYDVYLEECDNIQMFLANNQYSEVEEVAKQILKLVRDKNYKYNEISVITQNIDTYSNLCKAIFSKYNIPVYIDEKSELNQNLLVKYILAILEIFAKNWSKESIFNYIKSGFTDLSEEDIYLLERYCVKWNIRGNKWYKEDWNFHDEKEFGKEKIVKINELRKAVVEPLLKLRNNLVESKTAIGISKSIYNFLIENKIDEKIIQKINELKNKGELNVAEEYEVSLKIIMQVLDEIVMVFGDDFITFDDYMKTLQTGFGNSNLGTIPMAQDQVVVGDVDRSRSHKVRAVFIIGLNDGNFPSVNKAEGFLNDNDRDEVKKYGVELAKGTLERIYEDNFNVYKAFTTPEEKLILSYASADAEGKSLRPSTLVSKIKKMFKNLIVDSDIIKEEFSIDVEGPTFEQLIEELREFRDGKEIDSNWFVVYNIFDSDLKWNIKLKNAIRALNYTNTPDRITKENIDRMYGNTLQTSVSRLEQYRKCPFSYYLKYGLKLNEKSEFKVGAVDTGSFMHDIIDSFFSELDEKQITVRQVEEKEIEQIVEKIIKEKMRLDQNYVFSTSAKYINLVRRLKKVVTTSIKYIVQTIKQSDFDVFGHEVEFGKNSKYKPITLHTDSGKTVEIVGKIDIVDIAKNPDGTYVRIIDYKSSVKNIDLNQVVAGLQLQLLTYLNETCKVEDFLPAGVLYFNLSEPNVSANNNMTDEEIAEAIKQEFKMKGLILADVNVIKMMDNKIEQTGGSEIIPAGIKNNGEINSQKTRSAINAEQFKYLQKYMDKIIKQISEEILKGDIGLRPYYNMKVQKGRTPCEYCSYKSICRFDVNNKGNTYNYLESLNKDAILENIKDEV